MTVAVTNPRDFNGRGTRFTVTLSNLTNAQITDWAISLVSPTTNGLNHEGVIPWQITASANGRVFTFASTHQDYRINANGSITFDIIIQGRTNITVAELGEITIIRP